MKKFITYLKAIIAIIGFGAAANAQCPAGQADVSVDIATDTWGYEVYWEYTPTGSACGTGTLGSFGNAGVVGCAGGGGQIAAGTDLGAYGDNITVTENLGCLTLGSCYDFHLIDDWGDGGNTFDFLVDGVSVASTATAGPTEVFNFCVTAPAAYDVEMQGGEEYTLVPLTQVTAIGAAGVILNGGSSDVTNAFMTVNVYDGTMTNVYTGVSNTVATILSGASSPVTATGFTPTTVDTYTVELISNITELDSDLTNDTTYSTYVVTDSIYGRDNGTISNLLGVGAGTAATVGQNFDLVALDTMTTVSFFVAPGAAGLGDSISVSIYNVVSGTPTAIIGGSMIYNLTVADTVAAGAFITLPVTDIASNPLILASGTYYVGVNEYTTVDNMALAFTNAVYTPNAAWISIDGGAFATSEALGFAGAYIVRPNFAPYVCVPTGSTVTDAACNTYTWAQNGAVYTTTGMYNDTVMNAEGCDSIITLDLTINLPESSTDVQSSCSDYVWPTDGQTYTATGMYTATLMNVSGCDSIVTLDLTIGALDNSTTTAGTTISANAAGLVYQWIDCGNANAFINGENGQSFTATSNGDYAVIITDGACVDTSDCAAIVTVGLTENPLEQGLEIFPNPSNGNFKIAISDITSSELTVAVTEANGKVVFEETVYNVSKNVEIPVQLKGLNTGVYFVEISTDTMQTTRRVIVTK